MSSELSVVVPIYNVEKYLNRCIDSILSQTLLPDEIILVDDGSTDGSGKIADEYAQKYDSIKVIHQKNGGLSAARNTGIDTARGFYIAFVDSDDYIDSEMYKVLIDNLKRTNADISICGRYIEQENGERHPWRPIGCNEIWNTEQGLIQLNNLKSFDMAACDKLFKRSLFEQEAYGEKRVRFPVGKLSEDVYTMYKLVARAKKIVYTSTPLYHYVQRTGSISRSKKNYKNQFDYLQGMVEQDQFYGNWFPELKYVGSTALFFAYNNLYNHYFRDEQLCPKDIQEKINIQCRFLLKSVLSNPYLPKVRKAQACVFCCSKKLYNLILLHKGHLNR